MAQNGWNKVEQGWNRVWAIRMDHYDPFTALLNLKFGPQEVPKWVKMAQKCSFEVQLVCSGPGGVLWYVAQVVVGVLVVAWGRGVVVVWGEERLITSQVVYCGMWHRWW